MCSYTTSTGTKDVEETDADGNVTTVTKSVLYVNVTLKSYRDMIWSMDLILIRWKCLSRS